jgi:hypothetical protein
MPDTDLTPEQIERARALLEAEEAKRKAIIQACNDEINAVLKKYNCDIVMIEPPRMGIVVITPQKTP